MMLLYKSILWYITLGTSIVLSNFVPPTSIFVPTKICGHEYGIVTASLVQMLATFYLSNLLPKDDSVPQEIVNLARSAVLNEIKYNFQPIKVCLSCNEVTDSDIVSNTAFASTYCDPNYYGYNARLSGLIFVPLERDTNEPIRGMVRGFVSAPSTRPDLFRSVTEAWPNDFQVLVDNLFNADQEGVASILFSLQTFLSAILAATSGVVVMIPDYLGYGNSFGFDRPYWSRLPYQHSIVMTYLAAQEYFQDKCMSLDKVVTVTGYGEGGYGSIPGAIALDQLGVRVLSLHTGGGPLDLIEQTKTMLQDRTSFDDSIQVMLLNRLYTAMFVFGYSNEFPFLSNSGMGQRLVDVAYWPSFLEWFQLTYDSSEVLERVPENAADLIDSTVTQTFQNNASPCNNAPNNIASICQALQENSLMEDLSSIPCPTWLCYTPFDTVSHVSTLPDFAGNNNVNYYSPFLDVLKPSGDHASAQLICAIDPILTLSSSTGNDSANLIVYWDDNFNTPTTCAELERPMDPIEDPTLPGELKMEVFEGLMIDLVGLEELLDIGAFQELTEGFVDSYYLSLGIGIDQISSDIEVTSTMVISGDEERRQRRRSLQDESILRVVFTQTVEYYFSNKSDIVDAETFVALPFSTMQGRESYVTTLVASELADFTGLQEVSDLMIMTADDPPPITGNGDEEPGPDGDTGGDNPGTGDMSEGDNPRTGNMPGGDNPDDGMNGDPTSPPGSSAPMQVSSLSYIVIAFYTSMPFFVVLICFM